MPRRPHAAGGPRRRAPVPGRRRAQRNLALRRGRGRGAALRGVRGGQGGGVDQRRGAPLCPHRRTAGGVRPRRGQGRTRGHGVRGAVGRDVLRAARDGGHGRRRPPVRAGAERRGGGPVLSGRSAATRAVGLLLGVPGGDDHPLSVVRVRRCAARRRRDRRGLPQLGRSGGEGRSHGRARPDGPCARRGGGPLQRRGAGLWPRHRLRGEPRRPAPVPEHAAVGRRDLRAELGGGGTTTLKIAEEVTFTSPPAHRRRSTSCCT